MRNNSLHLLDPSLGGSISHQKFLLGENQISKTKQYVFSKKDASLESIWADPSQQIAFL